MGTKRIKPIMFYDGDRFCWTRAGVDKWEKRQAHRAMRRAWKLHGENAPTKILRETIS